MSNLRFEKVSFNELKFLECGINAKEKKVYGIKRHVKVQLDKLNASIKKHTWLLPLIVAELPTKEKYLIDGYARWRLEDPDHRYAGITGNGGEGSGGFVINARKHDAVIIPVRDLNQTKELYLQCQSSYGSSNWTDFEKLWSKEEWENKTATSESDYEIPGLVHPNFDLSVMTREQVAEEMLKQKYQII